MSGETGQSPLQMAQVRQYQPLVVLLAAVVVGIVLDRLLVVCTHYCWWPLAAVSCGIWYVVWRAKRFEIAVWILLVSVVATAGAWHHMCWYRFGRNDLGLVAREAPQPVCFEAVARIGPRTIPAPPINPLRSIIMGRQTRMLVDVVRVRDASTWRTASGRARLYVDGDLPGVRAGDRLRIFAQLLKPRPAQNPREFDLSLHHRADRILSRAYANYPECVSVQAAASVWSPRNLLERIRTHFNDQLWRHLTHDRSGLAAAVILGAREQLDPQRVDDFVVTGTIHLFAISGLHIGILAAGMFVLARVGMLPRRWALFAVVALTVLYALLTDARPPVVRATILVVVTCVSLMIGRKSLPFNSLAAAAIGMLAYNPADLFRSGAQLSFLAVATLAWFGPRLLVQRPPDPLKQLLRQSRPWIVRMSHRALWHVTRFTLASGAIWLVSLPLVMYQFHLFSPIAVLLNAVLWIPIACALFAGFGVVLTSWIPPVAATCGMVCDLSLGVLEYSVSAAKRIELGHFWVAGPVLWWLIGFYCVLGFFVAFRRWCPRRRWCIVVLSVWIAIGWAVPTISRHHRTTGQQALDCTILYVGHGCSAVFELPGGQTMLYDAGTLGSPIMGTRSIASFLWSRGVKHLDAVVISHADVDHYNALPGLLDRFSVERIFVSPKMFSVDDPALAELRTAIRNHQIPIGEIRARDRLRIGSTVAIDVLHPPAEGVDGSDNANSVVLLVKHGDRTILLPGDLETPGLDQLMARQPVSCDLVMAPHHGSAHSDPVAFSAWCQPGWVVISSGHGHDTGPAERAFRAAGSRVLHTVENGAVRATLDDSGLRIRRWRQDGW